MQKVTSLQESCRDDFLFWDFSFVGGCFDLYWFSIYFFFIYLKVANTMLDNASHQPLLLPLHYF